MFLLLLTLRFEMTLYTYEFFRSARLKNVVNFTQVKYYGKILKG